jgi:hypothetical protein
MTRRRDFWLQVGAKDARKEEFGWIEVEKG